MYTGLTGALYILQEDGLPENGDLCRVGYISGWSLEDKSEIIETTKIGRRHKEAYSGFQSWSASADGVVVFDDSSLHKLLFAQKHMNKKVKLKLYLNDNSIEGASGDNAYFEGFGFIESLSVDLSAEDKGNISISIKGTGQLDLFVNNVNIKTGLPRPEMFFKMKIDENGDLIVATSEICNYMFNMDDDGYLKVTIN